MHNFYATRFLLQFCIFVFGWASIGGLTDDSFSWEHTEAEEPHKDSLVFVHAIWRHGDRSPTNTWKNDQNREKAWPQGWGQLSKKGMSQHVTLGKRLREKYIREHKLVNDTYKKDEIYVRSSDYDRTIISAISNMIGFYNLSGSAGTDYPESNWPKGYTPVPVHTAEKETDHIGNPESRCPRRNRLIELWSETPEYKNLLEKKQWVLANLTKTCGQEINMTNINLVYDTLFIEGIYKNHPSINYPNWANGDIKREIDELKYIYEDWQCGRMAPFKGVNFTVEMPRMRVGSMLWDMAARMQEKVTCSKYSQATNKVVEPKDCENINRLKYYVYSGHDTTIAGLFTAFGFKLSNFDERGWPEYSSSITLELWKSDDDSFYIKAFYWVPGKEPKDMTAHIVGCQEKCNLDAFVNRSSIYKTEPDFETYCANTDFNATPTTSLAGNSTPSASLPGNLLLSLALLIFSMLFTTVNWPHL